MKKIAIFCASCLLLSSYAYASWTLPQNFCFEMPAANNDGNGMIYGELNWTDSTHTSVQLNITEGYLKGKTFSGPYNSSTQKASLEISNDALFGTRSVSAGTHYTLDMTDPSLATISMYPYSSSTEPFLIGTSGRCTIDFNEHYCALIDDGVFDISFGAESSGYVSGSITEYPTGFTDIFSAPVSSGGLNLSWTSSAYGIGFDLDFTLRGLSGSVDFFGTPFKVDGIRDPITGGGCSNIKIYRQADSDANMYYNIPTIINDFVYIGSSGGHNWAKSTSNYISKVEAKTMKEVWTLSLGGEEVRGSAVLDTTGDYVYFVTEGGRVLDTSGAEPQGDSSGSTLYLYKISNPSAGAPSIIWKNTIASSRTSPTAYTIPSSGQYTPVVRSNGDVFVGGEKLNGFNSGGSTLSGFPYSTPYCPSGASSEVRNAPLIFTSTASRDYIIYISQCGMHALDIDYATEVWYLAPGLGQYLSSPQFGKISSTIDSVYVGLGTKLYCVNPEDGTSCSGWPGSPWPTSCDITGVTGEIRSSLIVDSSGDVYFGTKDDENSKVFKVSPSNCTSGTPEWSYNIGADVYPTGVLDSAGEYIVGNETWTTTDGSLNFYNTTTGSISRSLYLPGDQSWGGSLRIYHNSTDSTEHLVGTLDDGGGFMSGLIFSIIVPNGADGTAKNQTFRGSNENTGR